jgi:hypothetical protein
MLYAKAKTEWKWQSATYSFSPYIWGLLCWPCYLLSYIIEFYTTIIIIININGNLLYCLQVYFVTNEMYKLGIMIFCCCLRVRNYEFESINWIIFVLFSQYMTIILKMYTYIWLHIIMVWHIPTFYWTLSI